jgi:hypothetical protein
MDNVHDITLLLATCSIRSNESAFQIWVLTTFMDKFDFEDDY